MDSNIIFQIIILIFSVIIHEVSHGAMALAFGDKTAQYEGRLTLNPVKHIDWFGSIILPLLLYISNTGFMIGWAKPVPYNPYNLKNAKVGEPMVAFAGPLSNIIVAVIFGLIIRFVLVLNPSLISLVTVFSYVVIINISLAIFNLVPIPPLDGSKILFSIFPNRFAFSETWARYGIFIIILLLTFISRIISPIIFWLFTLITGLN
ncbi:MAG: site-2 protease family protein [Candidatus Pacebacteria bacterium]|nr:site-2 protease family protein [Candidatus Paceibacterota bacterium]